MIHLELFWSFFQIGLFSIGGGYAAMPLIQHQVVELHPWLTLEQFSDIITISQMTPGPIAINSATFVGLQLGGCCFSKRMRKLFIKNEKSVLRFCNKSSKTKRAFTKVLMPCKRPF